MKRTVKSFPAEKSQNKTATIRPGSEYNGEQTGTPRSGFAASSCAVSFLVWWLSVIF